MYKLKRIFYSIFRGNLFESTMNFFIVKLSYKTTLCFVYYSNALLTFFIKSFILLLLLFWLVIRIDWCLYIKMFFPVILISFVRWNNTLITQLFSIIAKKQFTIYMI